MSESIEHILAWVTVGMASLVTLAHACLTSAERMHDHALTTPDDRDDEVTRRILRWAEMLDALARALGHVATLFLFARRGVEKTPTKQDDSGGAS